jgi:alkylation response protein AidB-like acyl-CoA dehydrogenase
MDFRFSPAQESLRQDVRAMLSTELPVNRRAESGESDDDEQWSFGMQFTRKLAERGWLTAHWPKEYGGGGFSIMEQVVLREELAYRGAPVLNFHGTNMVGPTLMLYGTDEQKDEHLPKIASCEVIWCQGYSEPGAGSDLASVQTRAIRDGDEYIVNGQKIWTSLAHRADWIFLLARTDPDAPKHRGISFLMADLRSTSGITIRPLINMAGGHGFSEVFFDNVRIPMRNRVGEENRGWYVGATLLDFERSNITGAATAKRSLEELLAYCRQEGRAGLSRGQYSALRHELADLSIATEVGRMISYRVATIQQQGGVPNYEASVAKLFHSELSQRIARAGINAMGLYGSVRPETPRWAKLRGQFALSYMTSVPATIAAGSSEIQRNIIATRGLAMPRG